jgi:hypothetical protein
VLVVSAAAIASAGTSGCGADAATTVSSTVAATTTPASASLPSDPMLLAALGGAHTWTPLDAARTGSRFPLTAVDPADSIYTAYAAASATVDGVAVDALVLRYEDAAAPDGRRLLLNHFAKSSTSRDVNGVSVFQLLIDVEGGAVENRFWYAEPNVVMVQGPSREVVEALVAELVAS